MLNSAVDPPQSVKVRIHHLNCGYLHAPPSPRVGCHCLLLENESGLVLVDTGIGLEDIRHPVERIGQQAIDMAGFQFDEAQTALRQIARLGLSAADVRHIVLTHADPDHAGGLSDFPNAAVHTAAEEHANIARGGWRYRSAQFEHGPKWVLDGPSDTMWFGVPARRLQLEINAEVFLVPLSGHTLGHCGVAIQNERGWTLHVGDAYYLRVELDRDDHPVSQIAAQRADDDALRRASLEALRGIRRAHPNEVTMLGYHDLSEFPE